MKDRLDAAMLAAAREEGHAAIPPWTLEDVRHRHSNFTCRRTLSNWW
jgi:hypothetical protein